MFGLTEGHSSGDSYLIGDIQKCLRDPQQFFTTKGYNVKWPAVSPPYILLNAYLVGDSNLFAALIKYFNSSNSFMRGLKSLVGAKTPLDINAPPPGQNKSSYFQLFCDENNVAFMKVLFLSEELDLKKLQLPLDNHKCLPLSYAVLQQKPQIVSLLLPKVDPNQRDNSRGYTALHHAVANRDIEMVKLLLSSPAVDITVEDEKGKRPLQLLTEYDKAAQEIYQLFSAHPKFSRIDVISFELYLRTLSASSEQDILSEVDNWVKQHSDHTSFLVTAALAKVAGNRAGYHQRALNVVFEKMVASNMIGRSNRHPRYADFRLEREIEYSMFDFGITPEEFQYLRPQLVEAKKYVEARVPKTSFLLSCYDSSLQRAQEIAVQDFSHHTASQYGDYPYFSLSYNWETLPDMDQNVLKDKVINNILSALKRVKWYLTYSSNDAEAVDIYQIDLDKKTALDYFCDKIVEDFSAYSPYKSKLSQSKLSQMETLQVEVVRLLLQKYDLNCLQKSLGSRAINSFFILAVVYAEKDFVANLLTMHKDKLPPLNPALHIACVKGREDIVELLLAPNFIDLSLKDEKKCETFYKAWQYGRFETLKYLLKLPDTHLQLKIEYIQKIKPINSLNTEQLLELLVLAHTNRHFAFIQAVLINPNVALPASSWRTFFTTITHVTESFEHDFKQWVTMSKNKNTQEILLYAFADSLSIACSRGKTQLVQWYLQQPETQLTPDLLTNAAANGHGEIVQALLAHHAPIELGKSGHLPQFIEMAIAHEHEDIVTDWLEQHPQNLSAALVFAAQKVSEKGNTVLYRGTVLTFLFLHYLSPLSGEKWVKEPFENLFIHDAIFAQIAISSETRALLAEIHKAKNTAWLETEKTKALPATNTVLSSQPEAVTPLPNRDPIKLSSNGEAHSAHEEVPTSSVKRAVKSKTAADVGLYDSLDKRVKPNTAAAAGLYDSSDEALFSAIVEKKTHDLPATATHHSTREEVPTSRVKPKTAADVGLYDSLDKRVKPNTAAAAGLYDSSDEALFSAIVEKKTHDLPATATHHSTREEVPTSRVKPKTAADVGLYTPSDGEALFGFIGEESDIFSATATPGLSQSASQDFVPAAEVTCPSVFKQNADWLNFPDASVPEAPLVTRKQVAPLDIEKLEDERLDVPSKIHPSEMGAPVEQPGATSSIRSRSGLPDASQDIPVPLTPSVSERLIPSAATVPSNADDLTPSAIAGSSARASCFPASSEVVSSPFLDTKHPHKNLSQDSAFKTEETVVPLPQSPIPASSAQPHPISQGNQTTAATPLITAESRIPSITKISGNHGGDEKKTSKADKKAVQSFPVFEGTSEKNQTLGEVQPPVDSVKQASSASVEAPKVSAQSVSQKRNAKKKTKKTVPQSRSLLPGTRQEPTAVAPTPPNLPVAASGTQLRKYTLDQLYEFTEKQRQMLASSGDERVKKSLEVIDIALRTGIYEGHIFAETPGIDDQKLPRDPNVVNKISELKCYKLSIARFARQFYLNYSSPESAKENKSQEALTPQNFLDLWNNYTESFKSIKVNSQLDFWCKFIHKLINRVTKIIQILVNNTNVQSQEAKRLAIDLAIQIRKIEEEIDSYFYLHLFTPVKQKEISWNRNSEWNSNQPSATEAVACYKVKTLSDLLNSELAESYAPFRTTYMQNFEEILAGRASYSSRGLHKLEATERNYTYTSRLKYLENYISFSSGSKIQRFFQEVLFFIRGMSSPQKFVRNCKEMLQQGMRDELHPDMSNQETRLRFAYSQRNQVNAPNKPSAPGEAETQATKAATLR